MPRINRTGNVLAGVAGIEASIDGQNIPFLRGGAQWEASWMVVGQAEVAPDDWRLHEAIPATGETRIIAQNGCNALAAGGGRWLAFRPDLTLVSNIPGVGGANRYPLACDWDGTSAVLDDYRDGSGITIYTADGRELVTLDVGLTYLAGVFLRGGLLTYHERGVGWRLYDVSHQMYLSWRPRADANWVVPVLSMHGELWLLERHDDLGLTVRRKESPILRVVVPGPSQELFDPDAVFLPDESPTGGTLRVCYSLTIGEEAPNVRWVDVPDLSALPTVDWTTWQPPKPALPPTDIATSQRPIWRGSLNGIVRGYCGNEPDAWHLIEDARYVTPDRELILLALFCDTKQTAYGWARTIEIAADNKTPVILDPDGDTSKAAEMHMQLEAEGIRVVPARQCYPAEGESTAQYEERMARLPECVIRPLYLLGGKWTEQQVAECNLALDRLIAQQPHVIMDLGFGLDRPPRSQWCAEYFQKLVDATPGPGPSLRQSATPPVWVPPVNPTIPPDTTYRKQPWWASLFSLLRRIVR